jgi:hypothetical protein
MNPIDGRNPIDDALLAVLASIAGDTTGAQEHLDAARRHAQTGARRHRQLVEITGLVVAGAGERAGGLALVHAAEFPDDSELLARLLARSASDGPPREAQSRHTDGAVG